MSQRLGLEPAWVEDLLSIWADADVGAVTRGLDHAGACPMFQLWGVVDDGVEADSGYGSHEVAATRAAVDRLRQEQPHLFEAVLASFKPWAGIVADADTAARAREAATLLAAWIDEACG